MDGPNLDLPGKPMIILVDGAPVEVEQTKRQNYQDLATACGACENVTEEASKAAGLDWREWSYFVLDLLEDQQFTEEHMLAYETNYEAIHGAPPPGVAEL